MNSVIEANKSSDFKLKFYDMSLFAYAVTKVIHLELVIGMTTETNVKFPLIITGIFLGKKILHVHCRKWWW